MKHLMGSVRTVKCRESGLNLVAVNEQCAVPSGEDLSNRSYSS